MELGELRYIFPAERPNNAMLGLLDGERHINCRTLP